jgi:rhodanese-related sulfurtransferase
VTSARVALQLQRKGITRVHPLEGGIAAWMARGFPVQPIPAATLHLMAAR